MRPTVPVLAPIALSHFDWRNPDLAPDRTCAAPLETLTPRERVRFAARSSHNVVHADQAHAPLAAGRLLADWRDSGALIRRQPALYLLCSRFPDPQNPDRPLTRHGVFGGLRVASPTLRPLECASPQAVARRLAALRQSKAQLSPVFALFDLPDLSLADMGRELEELFEPLAVRREGDVVHRLWRLPAPRQEALVRALAGAEVVVASGTEFFEAARIHREEQGGGDYYPWDFACACLANLAEPGLAALEAPVLIAPEPREDFDAALGAARDHFDIAPIADLDELRACPHAGAFALELPGRLILLSPRPDPLATAAQRLLDSLSQRQALCVFWRRHLRLGGHTVPRTAPDATQARLALAEGAAQAALHTRPASPEALVRAARLGLTLPAGAVRLAAPPPAGLLLHLLR